MGINLVLSYSFLSVLYSLSFPLRLSILVSRYFENSMISGILRDRTTLHAKRLVCSKVFLVSVELTNTSILESTVNRD